MNRLDCNVSLVMDEMSLKQHLEYDRNSDRVYGSTNIAALRLLGFSKNLPYFPNPSNNKNIHVIFHPPHLVKSIRNNLRRHNIDINGEIVSWQHIQSLYNLDKINSVRLASKLTDRHLDPGPLLSMKVKLATQVFSYQVASALYCCSNTNLLPLSVLPTARFVERMDTLFDILNSNKLYADKLARCALTLQGASISQLEELKYWIEKWKFCNVRNQTSISCFQFVCTSRFNQDCIENFFSIIRSKGGWNDRPNVRQFRAA
ncbi:uncharacterized protein LOC136095771 [Hydra vulgaris]|uniref:uncharacterized protein LOC136095771 n=1 Tax=Hydra vulgaris TaxID=6087 RepID=UPI0032EA19D8